MGEASCLRKTITSQTGGVSGSLTYGLHVIQCLWALVMHMAPFLFCENGFVRQVYTYADGILN